jgi:membrane protein required for colicin V production
MNWLDLLLLLIIALAAGRGYKRGFIIEFCSFLALWLGVYAALHFSAPVARWFALEEERSITAFLITFVAVLVLVHLLARALTLLIDLAQMGWANKLAGVGAGMLRSVFLLSILLNLLLAYTRGQLPPVALREDSVLAGPITRVSPILLPALGESKWVEQMLEDLQREARHWTGDPSMGD